MKKATVCMKCRSSDILYAPSGLQQSGTYYGHYLAIGGKVSCKKCGYFGLPLELFKPAKRKPCKTKKGRA